MNAAVGTGALWVALAATVLAGVAALISWAGVTGTAGAVRIAHRALATAAVSLAVAVAVLGWAMVSSDLTLAAVADHTRRGAAATERLAGLWAGLPGSLLCWGALVAAGGVWGLRRARSLGADTAAAATMVAVLVGGAVASMLRVADPFARLDLPALDGVGISPILAHPAMMVHPPLVYLGQALLVPLGVLGLAALRSPGSVPPSVLRRLALAAWSVSTVALAVGAEWAAGELGWGGYWAWDPVETSGLVPWLVLGVVVHELRRVDGRGPVPVRTALGTVAPLLLAVGAGVLTRSGAVDSVHAFGAATGVGRSLGLTLAATVAVVMAVVLVAACRRSGVGGRRVGPGGQATPNPEGEWLVGVPVWCGLGAAVVVAVGSCWPALAGDGRALDGSFFTRLAGPLAALGLVLAGLVGPRGVRRFQALAAGLVGGAALLGGWREPLAVVLAAAAAATALGAVAALGDGTGPGRRRGAHLAHLGTAILFLGVAGTTTASSGAVGLGVGDQGSVAGTEVMLVALESVPSGPGAVSGATSEHASVEAAVRVAGLVGGVARPRIDTDPRRAGTLAEPATLSSWTSDVVIVLRQSHGDRAILEVHTLPLVRLVWVGTVLIALGTALAAVAAPVGVSPGAGVPAGADGVTRARRGSGDHPAVPQGDRGCR